MSVDNLNIFEEGQILLFDKPLYWTSFDLVNKIRLVICRNTGRKIKVGHAGTLDPLATGLMIICTGKATKRMEEFMNLDKEYLATLHFGETTPSFDLETETGGKFPIDHITNEYINRKLNDFLGERLQIPPMHSAKMIDGKRAYELARKGIEKELKPVRVVFSELELVSFDPPDAKIRILCSKGTYIRSFARDFGESLKSGCYLSELVRTSIGSFKLSDSITPEIFEENIQKLQQIG
ncbi:MAG: tRNA pseudouridine(55) synthase TruB [Bacteroidales bacterium]|jgi:tRNA pseudouridine55 synthase